MLCIVLHRLAPVLLLLCSLLQQASTAVSSSITTSHLHRRQCIWLRHQQIWACNEYLPTLDQIIKRYRDIEDKGKATADNSVWFYTNLPTSSPFAILSNSGLCHGWLTSKGQESYSVFDGFNQDWRVQQEQWIHDHRTRFIELLPAVENPLGAFQWCFSHG